MELPDRGQASAWSGWEVLDLSGQSLGRCAGVFADTDTGVVEWLLVEVEDRGRRFVPAVDSAAEAGAVRLPFPRDLVLSAPDVGDAEQLAKGDEMELYRHYDVPWSDDFSDSLLPDQAVVADAAGLESAQDDVPPEPLVLDEPEPVVADLAVVPVELEPEPVVPEVSAPADRPQVTAQEAAAPVIATGAGVVALWVLLRALERRASRRRSPSVRTRKAGRQALRATATARQQAARRLSAAAVAAAEVSRQTASEVSDSAATASRAAEERRKTAAKAAAKRRKAAAKTAAKRRKAAATTAAKRRKTAAKATTQRRKELAKSRDHALKALRRRRRQVSKGASAATGVAATRTTDVTDAVAAAPARVARSARKARRSVANTLWNALTVTTAAGGYVLGARAGRERYEELRELGRSLATLAAERPEVQTAKQAVLNPEARAETARTVREHGRQLLSQGSGGAEQREG